MHSLPHRAAPRATHPTTSTRARRWRRRATLVAAALVAGAGIAQAGTGWREVPGVAGLG